MNNLLIIGALPPPVGGITIHLERFKEYLKNSSKWNVNILDLRKRILYNSEIEEKSFFKILFCYFNANIIHIHMDNNLKLLIVLLSRFLFKKVIYTHHKSTIQNKFVLFLTNLFSNHTILVNDKTIEKKYFFRKKTSIIPAFIPPQKFEKIENKLIESSINKYSYKIASYCFGFHPFNGNDLYGFDLIIDSFLLLTKNNQINNTLLILINPSNNEVDYEKLYEDKDLGSNKILLIKEKIDFCSLIHEVNLTIRATRIDGDSLSVRESLFFNTPVIASDATFRPEGTIIYENGNVKDLSSKILDLYKNSGLNYVYENIDYAKMVVDIYDDLSKKGKK